MESRKPTTYPLGSLDSMNFVRCPYTHAHTTVDRVTRIRVHINLSTRAFYHIHYLKLTKTLQFAMENFVKEAVSINTAHQVTFSSCSGSCAHQSTCASKSVHMHCNNTSDGGCYCRVKTKRWQAGIERQNLGKHFTFKH